MIIALGMDALKVRWLIMANSFGKYPRYKDLVEAAMKWNEGDVHSHAECAAIMGMQAGTMAYHHSVTAARKMLLNHQILLLSVHKEGYKTAIPDEFTGAMRSKIYASYRAMRHAANIDNAAPEERMSIEGKAQYRNLSDRMRVYGAMLSGVVKEVRQLASPKIKTTK